MSNDQPLPALSPSEAWATPEEVAERYDEWMRGDGPGVYRDQRRDLLIDTNDHIQRLREAHILFDGVIDSHSPPPFLASELAVVDRHVQDMITWLEDFLAAIEGCEYDA